MINMDLEAFQRELINSSMTQAMPSNAQEPVVLCNETLISLLDKHAPEATKRVPGRPDSAWHSSCQGGKKGKTSGRESCSREWTPVYSS